MHADRDFCDCQPGLESKTPGRKSMGWWVGVLRADPGAGAPGSIHPRWAGAAPRTSVSGDRQLRSALRGCCLLALRQADDTDTDTSDNSVISDTDNSDNSEQVSQSVGPQGFTAR
jgi:hypothetical protein